MPSKVWKGKSWNDPTANSEILNPTILLGPYKVKEFKQAEVATFDPVTTHYAGKPSLEQIILKPGQQPTVAYELLKSGQAQWAPNIPPARSPIGRPMRTGAVPGSPVRLIAPPIACRAKSKAGRSRYGPSCP